MEQGTEQNKTEEATPFKLKRAREKGMVARGIDLGFFSALTAFAGYFVVAGDATMATLKEMMRAVFRSTLAMANGPEETTIVLAQIAAPALQIVAGLGATIVIVVIVFEILQVRGIVFTAQPLKPDFSRLNPAKGLKRLFSARMLKETAKSVIKLGAYFAGAYLVVKYAFDTYAHSIGSAVQLSGAIEATTLRLLFTFILVALFIAVIDQVMSRQDFRKQMRMSRSELTREHKEREGEPRLKQRRKQLHAEFASQQRALQGLGGADMIIVNPEHFAVALRYDAETMSAPCITVKGRNLFALQMKKDAQRLGVPIFEAPPLARALYRSGKTGKEAPAQHYREIADLYLRLYRDRRDNLQ